jgi:hypothetical protein
MTTKRERFIYNSPVDVIFAGEGAVKGRGRVFVIASSRFHTPTPAGHSPALVEASRSPDSHDGTSIYATSDRGYGRSEIGKRIVNRVPIPTVETTPIAAAALRRAPDLNPARQFAATLASRGSSRVGARFHHEHTAALAPPQLWGALSTVGFGRRRGCPPTAARWSRRCR